jgi:hypothetical protein
VRRDGGTNRSHHVLEKAFFQLGAIDPSGDEDDSGPVVGVGPSLELDWGMEDVVDTVDCHRRGFVDQVEDTFDAQQILAYRASHPAEP